MYYSKKSENAFAHYNYCSLPDDGSGNHCNVGYIPSTSPESGGGWLSWYYTQEGSSCPCTCLPDSVTYPTKFNDQRNCATGFDPNRQDCMETVM